MTTECTICLQPLSAPGVALFVAECGHSFHFRLMFVSMIESSEAHSCDVMTIHMFTGALNQMPKLET